MVSSKLATKCYAKKKTMDKYLKEYEIEKAKRLIKEKDVNNLVEKKLKTKLAKSREVFFELSMYNK